MFNTLKRMGCELKNECVQHIFHYYQRFLKISETLNFNIVENKIRRENRTNHNKNYISGLFNIH